MQFLFPAFLWALAALAIPVIIHLFYFRRFKRVWFTNVKFLREVKEETSMRSRLRNLLVLAARLLALAALVFAFAQPFLPQENTVKTGRKAVSVFIDNSFSMSALSEDVPLLEKAKQRAREIVGAFSLDDRFQILTNDFDGRAQRLVSKEEALAMIDDIRTGPAVRTLSVVTERQKQAMATERLDHELLFIISDFQQNTTDLEVWKDTSRTLSLVPLQAVQERNVGIDTAWFEAPVPLLNQNNRLLVSVHNFSDEDLDNVRLSLQYNGEDKPEGVLTIPARSSVQDTVNIQVSRPGWQEAVLKITDYPIQFDDNYHFSFQVAEKIKVLVIDNGTTNRFLAAALQGIGVFATDRVNSQAIDYGSLAEYQMIVLQGVGNLSTGLASELSQYARNGGNVLLFPDRNADLNSYRNFLTGFRANELQAFDATAREVGDINVEEFVFNDVFENKSANLRLPATQGNFPLTRYNGRQEEVLMSYRDGTVFLAKYRAEQGHLYLCTAPIDEQFSNLGQQAEIFIPMLYKMAISAGTSRPIAYTIGEDEVVEAKHQQSSAELVYKLRSTAQEGQEFIPQQRVVGSKVYLSIDQQIAQAGFYKMYRSTDDDLDRFAFNYNRKESELDYYTPAELKSRFGNVLTVLDTANDNAIGTLVAEQNTGVVLWRWLLIAALLFLAIEILLLRFWRV